MDREGLIERGRQRCVDREGTYVDRDGGTETGRHRGVDNEGWTERGTYVDREGYVDKGWWREGIVSRVVTFVIQLPAPAATI